ncbi:MAG TPA: hypothetical protein PKD91_01180, partial [Bacteroidia bacterium]|nr:hypothetical protein [Bacteroidia bacterium]
MKGFTLQEITDFLKSKNYKFSVSGNNGFEDATEYFLSSIRNKIPFGIYFLTAETISQASAITGSIILTDYEGSLSSENIVIHVQNPQLMHYRLALSQEIPIQPFIHPTAIIHPEAKIASSVYIGPFCIIQNCILGENVALLGHITVNEKTEIRKNTIIESHSVI